MKTILTLIIIGVIVYFLIINPPEAVASNSDYLYLKNLLTDTQSYNSLGNNLMLGSAQLSGLITNKTICGVDVSALGLAAGVPSGVDLHNAMKALIYKESSGNCQAYAGISNYNSLASVGLCQITEPVATLYGFTIEQAASAGTNVYIGTQYFISMLKTANWDLYNAYAAYNGGSKPSAQAFENAAQFMLIYNNYKTTGIWSDTNGNAFSAINCNC